MMLWFLIKDWFAGVWPIVAHIGVGLILTILLTFASIYSPVFKKALLWLATIVLAITLSFAWGVRDEKVHRDAQAALVKETVSRAVADAKSQWEIDRAAAAKLPDPTECESITLTPITPVAPPLPPQRPGWFGHKARPASPVHRSSGHNAHAKPVGRGVQQAPLDRWDGGN